MTSWPRVDEAVALYEKKSEISVGSTRRISTRRDASDLDHVARPLSEMDYCETAFTGQVANKTPHGVAKRVLDVRNLLEAVDDD